MTTEADSIARMDEWSAGAKSRLLADVMAEPCRGGCGDYDCCGGHECDGGMIHSDSPADLADLNASITDILMQPTLEQLQRRVITAARMLVEADDAEGTDWCHFDGLYECVMAEAKAARR